jgi:ATP-dependent helicase STH1/SNF2
LNDILARGDEERALFAQMDEDRKAEERATGAPPRLIQLVELPEPYTRKYEPVDELKLQQEADLIAGRGQRKKVQINYNDEFNDTDLFGGDEDEDEDDNDYDAGERRAKRRRGSMKAAKEEESATGTPTPQDSKRKGRGAKRNLAANDLDDTASLMSDDQPRKRRRRGSVDPSEDEPRAGVSGSRGSLHN